MASETGGGGRGGKKRYNSQPMEGSSKDSRYDENIIDEDLSWSTVVNGRKNQTQTASIPTSNSFNLLTTSSSYPDKTMRSNSISSRGSRGNRGASHQDRRSFNPAQASANDDRPRDLGESTRFVTPEQSGPYRDEIVVECQKLNDRPFKGTITFREATDVMFTRVMGFEYGELYSVRMRYSGCPTVRFKLKQQINIDDLISVEHFNIERRAPNSEEIDYISCKILGIRGMSSVPHYDGTENDIRWVKIEGTEYLLTEAEIRAGLEPFGELLTPIREDIHDDSDDERGLIGNGTYSVKMRLQKPIPQFLPLCSRRIRIYHNGITKLCSNCYGRHTRRQCRNQKRQWIEYVRDFMLEHENLQEEYYGKWWDIIDTEYPGYFDQKNEESAPADVSTGEHSQERRQKVVSRFAEKSNPPPLASRDPRINRQNDLSRQRSQNQPEDNSHTFRNIAPSKPDRQQEMSRLLANGLTLTDARKYLANKEEQDELERRMMNPNSQNRNGSTRGRDRNNH